MPRVSKPEGDRGGIPRQHFLTLRPRDPIREMKTEAANVDVCEEQTDTELGKEGGDASQEPPPL